MAVVFSGIQPTGNVHLGNYFGSLVNWVKMQNEANECFFMIANQHAITLPQNSKELASNTLKLAAILLAIGLDPQKVSLFVQTDIPEHAQFAWILNCIAPMGQIERMTQFKEKSEKDFEASTVGLFTYPILQAADILLYKATIVPVGIDQAQHLELTRTLAERFNRQFKDIFPLPQTLHTETTKVVGLDGTAKMSKSKNNYIGLVEDEAVIWDKLSKATTDSARVTRKDPGNPGICNIYTLHKLLSSSETQMWSNKGCRSATIGCIECKRALCNNIIDIVRPIRERYYDWISKPDVITDILYSGAKKARGKAQETLAEVYEAVGFKYGVL